MVFVKPQSYNDGGSIEYRYHDYTILKLNKIRWK